MIEVTQPDGNLWCAYCRRHLLPDEGIISTRSPGDLFCDDICESDALDDDDGDTAANAIALAAPVASQLDMLCQQSPDEMRFDWQQAAVEQALRLFPIRFGMDHDGFSAVMIATMCGM